MVSQVISWLVIHTRASGEATVKRGWPGIFYKSVRFITFLLLYRACRVFHTFFQLCRSGICALHGLKIMLCNLVGEELWSFKYFYQFNNYGWPTLFPPTKQKHNTQDARRVSPAVTRLTVDRRLQYGCGVWLVRTGDDFGPKRDFGMHGVFVGGVPVDRLAIRGQITVS